MKTNDQYYFAVLFLLISEIILAQGSLIYRDADRTWINEKGTITYAEYVLRPMKTHVVCDLYLTYDVQSNKFNNTDNYEIYQQFELPANTLVTDSWLWVDTVIMKAKILERSEAINIYEGIVNRRRDPSLLLKNSPTNYSLNIYPVKNKSFRRIKLRFEIPILQEKNERTFSVPTSLIMQSVTVPSISFKIFDDYHYDIYTAEDIPLLLTNDPNLGIIYKVVKKPELHELTFKIKDEPASPVSIFAPDPDLGESRGRYQVSFKPTSLFEFETHEPRNILLLIDHDSLYSNLTKADVLSCVKEFVQSNLSADDTLQIVYNSNSAKSHFPGFIPQGVIGNYPSIQTIKLGNYSQLPGSLFESYALLQKKTNPVVIIFSSAGNLNSTSHAQSVKEELIASFGSLYKSFVFSYVNANAPRVFYSNQYFYGNNLFYNILISNAFGYLQWLPTAVKKFELAKPALKSLGEQFEELTQKPFQIQYIFRPSGGLSYDNIILQNNSRGYTQIGRYVGNPPMTIDAILFVDNQIQQKTVSFDVPVDSSAFSSVKRFHEGYKIMAMEQSNLLANKFNIIAASIDNRVLSRYTAFLALEPGLQDPCIDCVDESDTPSSTEDDIAGVRWKVYPNPFKDQLIIELTGLDSGEEISAVELFDVSGNKKNVDITFKKGNENWVIHVFAPELPAGVYVIKVTVGKRIVTYKLIKM